MARFFLVLVAPPRRPLRAFVSYVLLVGLLTVGVTADDAAAQTISLGPEVTGAGIHPGPLPDDRAAVGIRVVNDAIRANAPWPRDGSLPDSTAKAVGLAVDNIYFQSLQDEPFERGATIGVYIQFNTPVRVTGSPTLTLTIGSETREAQYHATYDVTPTLQQRASLFQYRVQATDYDPDGLSIRSDALRLNGGRIDGGDGPADLTLRSIVNHPRLKVDGRITRGPTVKHIYFSSDPQRGDTYSLGNSIEVAVQFSKDLISEGTSTAGRPTLDLQIGSRTRRAVFYASRPDHMYFRYAVQEEDRDENGISISANALAANEARIHGHGGVDADLRHPAVGDDPERKVNGQLQYRLQVTEIAFDSVPLCCDTYVSEEWIVVAVSFDQAIREFDASSHWPYLELKIGSETRHAYYVTNPPVVATGAGYGYLFAYKVQAADHDPDGVSIEANALQIAATDENGSPVDTNIDRHTIHNDAGHKVDGTYLGPRGTLPPLEMLLGDAAATVDVSAAFRGGATSYVASSSDPAVATVTVSGAILTVTPRVAGTATIEVTARNALRTASQSFVVTVITELEPVGTLPPLELVAGDAAATVDVTRAFRGGASAYAAGSSDPVVATVTVSYTTLTVTPMVEGTATIEVTARNRLGTASQSFVVTVVTDPAEVHVLESTLAAFGRSVLASVTTSIEGRFAAGRGATTISLAGRHLPVGPQAAGHAVGTGVALQPVSARGGAMGAPSSTARSAQDHTAAFVGGGQAGRLTGDTLLGGSHFTLALDTAQSADAEGDPDARWTVWGTGDLQSFAGELGNETSYDGGIGAGHVGVDVGGERWLAGASVSRSAGQADYRFSGTTAGTGRLTTTLTSVQPYLRWTPGRGTEVWGILGVGAGAIENVRSHVGNRAEASELAMWLGVVGGRRALASVGRVQFDLRGDVAMVRLETGEGPEAIDDLSATVQRYRVGVETSHTTRWTNGATFTPFAEVDGRHDAGDGQTGSGVEVAGGVRVRHPESGFGLEGRGRALLLHSASGYREHGISVTAAFAPGGTDGRGLSLEVTPGWGTPASGADALWRDQAFGPGRMAAVVDGASVDARFGYGFAMRTDRVLAPFSEIAIRNRDHRRLRMGLRLGSTGKALAPLQLELAGERIDGGGMVDHRLMVLGAMIVGS